MSRTQVVQQKVERARRVVRVQWLLGAMATAVVVLLQVPGTLEFVEGQTLDWRQRVFGMSSPGPSGRVVLVALDDESLRRVGRWPWDRSKLAEAIDELGRLGGSVTALDLLLDDPQGGRLAAAEERAGAGSSGSEDGTEGSVEGNTAGGEAEVMRVRRVDDDAVLAAAIERHGKVVLAGSFRFRVERENGGVGIVGGESIGALVERLQEGAQRDTEGALEEVPIEFILELFFQNPGVRAQDDGEIAAMVVRANPSLVDPANAGLVNKVVENTARKVAAARTLYELQFENSLAVQDDPATTADDRLWPRSIDPSPPIPVLATASRRLGSATWDSPDEDTKARRLPLWVRSGNRLWPTLGLASFLAYRGLSMSDVWIEGEETVISLPDGRELRVPMHRKRLTNSTVDGLHFLTWPRVVADWRRQFDPRVQITSERNTSIVPVYFLIPSVVQGDVRKVVRDLDEQLKRFAGLYLDFDEAWDARTGRLMQADFYEEEWVGAWQGMARDWKEVAKPGMQGTLEEIRGLDGATDEEKQMAEDIAANIAAFDAAVWQVDQILRRREEVRTYVKDKVCVVGWTSTGANADFVATSIGQKTPGPLVHMAVINALCSERFRTPPAWSWVDVIAAVGLGLTGTWLGIRAGVVGGPVVVVGLVAVWFVGNGVVLWDFNLTVVDVAGPSVAAGGGWLAVVLHKLLVEQRARKRTEERFRSYVSPAVVDILVSNPQLNTMEPQKRELSVMFSDVASFTTTSERLGSQKTAEFLGKYLGAMTDILQAHSATLDKYLGDGIMAFWGAPIEDARHALNAAETAVDMLLTLDRLNREKHFGEAGEVYTRIGLAAGELMVGDFGNPPRNSSYTVLGDTANFAARLESANKFFGTRILVSQRLYELLGDSMRTRPIGRIVVKGKKEPVGVWELIGDRSPHGERTDEWLELTREAVSAYQAGRFEEAMRHFDSLHLTYRDEELAEVYREAIQHWRDGGSGVREGFAGTIVLAEK